MKLSEMSNAQKSQWLAEKFRESNFRAWHENPDFVNDPAMTLMLKQELYKRCRVVAILYFNRGVQVTLGSEAAPDVQVTAETEGQAVVDASMLQMGWKEDQ